MKKLNLGSGTDYKEGWVNLDVNKNIKADIYHDLNKFPYPFRDNTFDLVVLTMVLEHLDNPLKVLGKICIQVPHWASYVAYGDLTHKNYFSATSFSYFERGRPKYYSDFADFKLIKKIYKSFRTNTKIWKPYELLCKILLEPILNSNTLLTEEILCKFLPINEIDFVLEVKK